MSLRAADLSCSGRRGEMTIRRLLTVLVSVGAAVAGGVASSSPAGAKDEIVVEAGVESTVMQGGAIPIKVAVTSDRLVRGEVRVQLSAPDFGIMGGSVRTVPLEVPAGATKVVTLVMDDPVPDFMGFGGQGAGLRIDTAFVSEGGQTVAKKRTSVREVAAPFVGLMPGVTSNGKVPKNLEFGPDLPNAAMFNGGMIIDNGGGVAGVAGAVNPNSLTPQEARFTTIDPETFSVPPWETVSQVIATPEDVSKLPEEWRQSLQGWVSRGGRLVIDSAPGVPLPGLPEAWTANSHSITYGVGEVAFTDGAAAAGEWTKVLQPTWFSNGQESNGLNIGMGFQSEAIRALAEVSGVASFGIKLPAVLLLIYILGVGPVLFIALGRSKRQPLAWALIPLAALIGTVVTWGTGSAVRANIQPGRISLIEVTGDNQRVTSAVGTTKDGSDNPRFLFPRGSRVQTLDQNDMFSGRPSPPTEQELTRAGLTISPETGRGDYAVAAASLDTPATNRLDISASRDGATGDILGEVKNTSELDLTAAIVYSWDGQAVNVGDISRGASKTFRLDASSGKIVNDRNFGTLSPVDRMAMKSWAQLEENDFGRQQDRSELLERPLGLWQLAATLSPMRWRTKGIISLAAWTTGGNPTVVTVDGASVKDGPTLFIQRERIASLAPFPNYRVAGALGPLPVTERFFVEAPASNKELKLIAPQSVGAKPKVWLNGAWVELGGEMIVPRRIPPDVKKVAKPTDEKVEPDDIIEGIGAVPAQHAPTTTIFLAPGESPPAPTATTTPAPPVTMAPAGTLFPDGASTGHEVAGPPVTIDRPAPWMPIVDIPEPRSQSNIDEPLLFQQLSSWDIPDGAVVNGQLFVAAPGGDLWQQPVQLIEVANV